MTADSVPPTAHRYTLSGSGYFKDQKLWQRGYSLLLVYFMVLLGCVLALDYFALAVLPGWQ